MSCQVKKRKTRWSTVLTTPPILSVLPDDLLVNCLARVPRLYYPTLSFVCKTFRSLVASPELYKVRSLIGRTENCLYVYLPFSGDLNPCWFTLYRDPDSSGKFLVPISSPKFPAQSCNFVAVGPKIYGIGRSSSSRVCVLDCRFHTWHKDPSMRQKRSCSSTASLVDGKIYVAGGNSLERVEVFDPKTQTWSSVTDPGIKFQERNGDRRIQSFGLEGEFYLFKDDFLVYDDSVVYNPKEGKWNSIPVGMNENIRFGNFSNYCVIDNVLFHWDLEDFKWYDSKEGKWKDVQGDFKDLSKSSKHWWRRTVGYGGKLVVLWHKICYRNGDDYYLNVFWCAEIALERSNGDDMLGKVEWLDVVLTVPGSCHLLKGSSLVSVTI